MTTSVTPQVFDELFLAIETDSLPSISALLSRYNCDPENRYILLTRRHPKRKLTVLQWAVKNYPKTTVTTIKILLEKGAGTELPIETEDENQITKTITEITEITEIAKSNEETVMTTRTPLWMAVEGNFPSEIISLLLSFKADVYFKSTDLDPEDEKSVLFRRQSSEGYSLLHLAVKRKCSAGNLGLLIQAGGSLLLNDQSNRLKETPLMLAVREKDLKMVKLLIDQRARIDLTNSEGLTACELAARDQNIEICFEFNPDVTDAGGTWYMEILQKSANTSSSSSSFPYWYRKNDPNNLLFRDLSESDELLPLDAYWQWQSDDWTSWRECFVYRLRKRLEIRDQPYLMEAIVLASQGRYQSALGVLLEGLQHESDPQKKSKAAGYFQRLLQRTEKTTPALGLLDSLSRTDLVIVNEEELDSDDSLLYCPVCSHRFDAAIERESHLKRCLTAPRHRIIGDRYTNLSQSNLFLQDECPICYEELRGINRVVVMNCLCRFHRKCIEEWLNKGKQCPFHSDH